MFIVLYLIFTNVYANSKPTQGTNKQQFDFIDSVIFYNESVSKPAAQNVTTIPKFSILLDNLNKRTNLKLSVFDKMLSDEMLSIQKNIHSKDVTFTSYVNLSAKYVASTPTLEIKQHWPTKKNIFFTREPKEKLIIINSYNDHNSKINDSTVKDHLIKFRNISNNAIKHLKKKVIGVRSFTDHGSNPKNHDEKKCTCNKGNIQCNKAKHASCTAQCCGNAQQLIGGICTRSLAPLCTRTVYPFFPYFAHPIVTPYLVITTDIPSDFDLIHKHHKTRKPYTEASDDEYAYNQAIEEEVEDHTKKYKIDYGVDESNYDNNNDNDSDKVEENIDKADLEKGYLQVDKDKIIDNIIDDLKVNYNDAVIKECYCSSWSTLETKYFTIYIIILIILFI